MPTIPELHLECKLLIDDAVAPEYGASSSVPKQATCFVEAATGKPFRIVVRSLRYISPRLYAYTFIDGVLQGRRLSKCMYADNPPHLVSVRLAGNVEKKKLDDGTYVYHMRKWKFKELVRSGACVSLLSWLWLPSNHSPGDGLAVRAVDGADKATPGPERGHVRPVGDAEQAGHHRGGGDPLAAAGHTTGG